MNNYYILAVDDEELNLIILKELLADKHELSCIKNGLDCLSSVNEKRPDLILMDVNMPGMSGLEACSILKKHSSTSSIPIIMLSALASTVEIEEGLKMGADAYIPKPFEEKQLLDTVNKYLT